MMVKLRDTPVASLAVFGTLKHVGLTNIAVVLVIIYIKRDLPVPSNLGLSF